MIDPVFGGLHGAPKFPQCSMLLKCCGAPACAVVTRYFARCRTSRSTASAQGGIYDHLGGGFSRYSVDELWLVPHFEKMLYDNAQLLELLASPMRAPARRCSASARARPSPG